MMNPPPALPRLEMICGLPETAVAAAQQWLQLTPNEIAAQNVAAQAQSELNQLKDENAELRKRLDAIEALIGK